MSTPYKNPTKLQALSETLQTGQKPLNFTRDLPVDRLLLLGLVPGGIPAPDLRFWTVKGWLRPKP